MPKRSKHSVLNSMTNIQACGSINTLPPKLNIEFMLYCSESTLANLANTSRFFDKLTKDVFLWIKKIRDDFEIRVESTDKHHEPKIIYRHLVVLEKFKKFRLGGISGITYSSYQRNNTYPPLTLRELIDESVEKDVRAVYLNQAAAVGNFGLVQWLVSPERGGQQLSPNQDILEYAAFSGNLTLVQWLMSSERKEQQLNPNQTTLQFAAFSGNFRLVQWLMSPERGGQQPLLDDNYLSNDPVITTLLEDFTPLLFLYFLSHSVIETSDLGSDMRNHAQLSILLMIGMRVALTGFNLLYEELQDPYHLYNYHPRQLPASEQLIYAAHRSGNMALEEWLRNKFTTLQDITIPGMG